MQRINLNGKDKAQETDVKVKSSIESRIEAADFSWKILKLLRNSKQMFSGRGSFQIRSRILQETNSKSSVARNYLKIPRDPLQSSEHIAHLFLTG